MSQTFWRPSARGSRPRTSEATSHQGSDRRALHPGDHPRGHVSRPDDDAPCRADRAAAGRSVAGAAGCGQHHPDGPDGGRRGWRGATVDIAVSAGHIVTRREDGVLDRWSIASPQLVHVGWDAIPIQPISAQLSPDDQYWAVGHALDVGDRRSDPLHLGRGRRSVGRQRWRPPTVRTPRGNHDRPADLRSRRPHRRRGDLAGWSPHHTEHEWRGARPRPARRPSDHLDHRSPRRARCPRLAQWHGRARARCRRSPTHHRRRPRWPLVRPRPSRRHPPRSRRSSRPHRFHQLRCPLPPAPAAAPPGTISSAARSHQHQRRPPRHHQLRCPLPPAPAAAPPRHHQLHCPLPPAPAAAPPAPSAPLPAPASTSGRWPPPPPTDDPNANWLDL